MNWRRLLESRTGRGSVKNKVHRIMATAVVIRKEESQSGSVEALIAIDLLQYLVVIIFIESRL